MTNRKRRTKGQIIRDTARALVVKQMREHGLQWDKPSPVLKQEIEIVAKELLWYDPMYVLNECFHVRSIP